MQSVVSRYYARYYATHSEVPQLSEKEEFSIYQHHNGLCVVVLGPRHPILTQQLAVERVDFTVGGSDRSKNLVRGKKKKGGLQVQPKTILCKIYTKPIEDSIPSTTECDSTNETDSPPLKRQKTTNNQTEWNVYACVKGFLIEPNLSLVNNPSLLQHKPDTEGYLAIIMPLRTQVKTVANHLLTHEQYTK